MRQGTNRVLPFGVAIAGLLILGFVVTVARTKSAPEPRLAAPRKRVFEPPPPERVHGVSGEMSTPTAPSTEREIAEAMDWTGLRHQTNRLRMAALQGDEAGRISAAAGLRLYGAKAAQYLQEQSARESDSVVRFAYEEARKGLR